jgi:hypothetical protein
LCVVPLEAVVDQALVEDGDESVVLDMRREVKVPVGSLNAPLLLELGGGFSKVCSATRKPWLADHGGRGTRGDTGGGRGEKGEGRGEKEGEVNGELSKGVYILPSSKYLYPGCSGHG